MMGRRRRMLGVLRRLVVLPRRRTVAYRLFFLLLFFSLSFRRLLFSSCFAVPSSPSSSARRAWASLDLVNPILNSSSVFSTGGGRFSRPFKTLFLSRPPSACAAGGIVGEGGPSRMLQVAVAVVCAVWMARREPVSRVVG
ncbi:hypothetical protein B0T26DRAFT_727530 [Lasiosphaeria miniovina]|uniref:Uncharacterized protein n=1 Tax=Lasiosphaeria miniovina TaxID=1954250 RepID=A0AA39ZZR1_9PEZI|nr:uncharacterized protein B0T26DRAFT_727530 [Lasiosphaeria miniovina]KAK0706652.1 hypothetical protein B0T26DRAFT_727530 [Lasiosphaeria miniovina]